MSRSTWKQPGQPRSSKAPRYEPDLADPARGEKVPRCRVCGMPERPGVKLYSIFHSYIRLNWEAPWCGKCIEETLPERRALDPLTLDDVA